MTKYYTAYLSIMENGERKYKKYYGKTQKEADAKRDKAKWEYENGLLTLTKKTTFGRYAATYFETYVKPSYGKKNYNGLRNLFFRVFSELMQMEIGSIRQTHLQRCINATAGHSKSYVKSTIMMLKAMFRMAVADDVIVKNPTLALVTPSYTEHERRALTEKERELLIAASAKDKYGVFFLIMLCCGLRPQEVRALTWNNIDFDRHTITVTGAIKNGTNEKGSPKSAAGYRTVPMPETLERFLDERPRSVGYIFGAAKPVSGDAIHRAWLRIHRQMDILGGAVAVNGKIITHSPEVGQDLTPYYLRHTYATSLAENGVDMKTAQYLLGHSSITMTAKVYTHVTPKMLDAAAEKLRDLI